MITTMKGIREEFGSMRDLVEIILEDWPETRNSDKLLLEYVCRKCGILTLHELTNSDINFETVRRVRQKIQNDEMKFMAELEIQEERENRENMFRKYLVEE